jgi:hypothetical protein
VSSIANANASDDRAFHVQVAFSCFLEPNARLGLSSGGGLT